MKSEDKQKNITDEQWKIIKKLFSDSRPIITRLAIRYYSIATVKKDGTPHVSPFGSVILSDKYKGIYFEGFSTITADNLKHNKHICIMAVNTSKSYWFSLLFRGKFLSPIGIRLNGSAGERRSATLEEKTAIINHLFPRWLRSFKGLNYLLSNMKYVRDIDFFSFEDLNGGEKTFRL